MAKPHSRTGEFRKVGENLFRYSSNGVYYARFRNRGKLIHRSLRTTDAQMAKRRLQEEIQKAGKVDLKNSRITLGELLELYDEKVGQYAPKTAATRRSILKIFKATWAQGLEIAVHRISTGHLELGLATHRARLRNASYNEYARFLRHLFDLAVKLRSLAGSPASGLRGLRVETPIRLTPTWEQFESIVHDTDLKSSTRMHPILLTW